MALNIKNPIFAKKRLYMFINTYEITRLLNKNKPKNKILENSVCNVIDLLIHLEDPFSREVCEKMLFYMSWGEQAERKFELYADLFIGLGESIIIQILNNGNVDRFSATQNYSIKVQELQKTIYNILSRNGYGFYHHNGDGIVVNFDAKYAKYCVIIEMCKFINNQSVAFDVDDLKLYLNSLKEHKDVRLAKVANLMIGIIECGINFNNLAPILQGESFATLIKMIVVEGKLSNIINADTLIKARNSIVHNGTFNGTSRCDVLYVYFMLLQNISKHKSTQSIALWIPNRFLHYIVLHPKKTALDISNFIFRIISILFIVGSIWFFIESIIGRTDVEIIELPKNDAIKVKIYESFATKDTTMAKKLQEDLRITKELKNNSYKIKNGK